MLTTADELDWEILQAKRHGGHAVHYVRVPSDCTVDTAATAFTPGSKMRVALGAEGVSLRYDHVSTDTLR